MKKIWFLAVGFVLGSPLGSSAEASKAETPPKVEESTRDTDKAAAQAASSEADKWAGTKKAEAPPKVEAHKSVAAEAPAKAAVQPVPVQTPPPPPPAETPKLAAKAPAPVTGLNEMRGKMLSKSYDPKTVRLIVDGGFNVEFPFDAKTAVTNGGSVISIDDLEYNDEVVIRYSGKDLYAVEIERVSKAPRPQ